MNQEPNCCFHREFKRIDSILKYFGVPFFSLVSIAYITPFFAFPEVLVCFAFNTLHVMGILWGIRYFALKIQQKFPEEKHLTRRILLHIVAAKIVPIVIITLGSYLYRLSLNDYQGFYAMLLEIRGVYLTGILFSLLICAFYENFLLFSRLSQKAIEIEQNKKTSLEAEYQNLTNKLNPHFLFNSFNTLSALIEENPDKGVNFVQELSTVYRYVLNSQKQTWIELQSEVEFSQSYLNLLKMRFEDGLDVEMLIDLDHHQHYILPLTLQLLIENAVKHNTITREHPLKIRIEAQKGYLLVENNRRHKMLPEESTRVGLKNIRDRYRFLTQRAIEIDSSAQRFRVKIPLIKKSIAA